MCTLSKTLYQCEVNETTTDSTQNIRIIPFFSALSFPFPATLKLRKESTQENRAALLSRAVANRERYNPPLIPPSESTRSAVRLHLALAPQFPSANGRAVGSQTPTFLLENA